MVTSDKDISFISVGGAGLRVAARAAVDCSDQVCVTVVDTDARALAGSSAGVKLQVGAERSGGQGCGGDAGIGRLSVEDDLASVSDLFHEQRLVVVFAGLGGGTGSGGAPTLLRAAREAGCVSVGMVTMPFAFEGAGRLEKAAESLKAVHGAADVVLAIPSDALLEHIGDRDVATTFSMADAILGESAAALCNLFARPGYIQLDLADLRSIAQHSEAPLSFGFGTGSGEGRVEQALSTLLDGPLLEKGAVMERAAGIMVGILGGEDLRLSEVSAIMAGVQARIPKDSQMVMGTTIDPAAGDSVTLIVLCADTWNEDALPPVPAAAPPSGQPIRRGSRNRSKRTQLQPLLAGLDMNGKDRFKGVEATIIDGEDLDTPTYVRRGIRLEK